jgi:hypothetical protein
MERGNIYNNTMKREASQYITLIRRKDSNQQKLNVSEKIKIPEENTSMFSSMGHTS